MAEGIGFSLVFLAGQECLTTTVCFKAIETFSVAMLANVKDNHLFFITSIWSPIHMRVGFTETKARGKVCRLVNLDGKERERAG